MAETERIVGVRELREQLSAFLRLVASGQSITIGNRSKRVARLVPANSSREQVALERLAELGVIRRSTGKPGGSLALAPRRRPARATSDLVKEDRG